jgi:alkanesulfonate monooxygenase SsuD/methylene tetrahydromethanopterin reductase-like flavin-dependent oxidoreductase (luciferase family)
VFGADAKYPFGGWSVDPADTWPEPMAVLAAIAGATRSLALVTNVLVAPLRSTPLLAKQVATLYGLSRGRFQLGVGTGWQRQEYEASGLDFQQRADLLFDQMRGCRELWHGGEASFASTHVNFERVWCSPALPGSAAQSPLQLWFGLAPTAGNARFFAEFPGAGWSCINPDPAFIASGRAALETQLRERFGVERPLRVRAAPQIIFGPDGHACIERSIDNLHHCVRAGVTDFDFPLMFFGRSRDRFDHLITAMGRIERRIDHYR